MDEIFENPYADSPEEPKWTKLQVVASTAIVFSIATISAVVVDKAIDALFKIQKF